MRKYAWIMIGMLIGASCLCQAYADTITTFDISGTVTPISPFSGTLVLDLDFGWHYPGNLIFRTCQPSPSVVVDPHPLARALTSQIRNFSRSMLP